MDSSEKKLILGEFRRLVDDRFRLSIPGELLDQWEIGPPQDPGAVAESAARGTEKLELVLAKERPGCLSLWQGGDWQRHLEAGIQVVQSKLQAGRLGDRLAEVQALGRLLSTRHRTVPLAGRGRLLVPEGFREFLRVEPGAEVLVIGAAVCIEIWQPEAWRECLNEEIPRFGSLLDGLSG